MENVEIRNIYSPTSYIACDGNVYTKSNKNAYYICNRTHIISNEYLCINELGNDHYAVCKEISNIPLEYNYYDLIKDEDSIEISIKWGVIRINRDEQGKVIPQGETLVVPYLYDRISGSNSKTAIVYHNNKLTYVELDKESENYGQQLVPCKLNHAVPFDIVYEGFAECSINKTVGFLCRDCKTKYFAEDDLLSGQQVQEFLNKGKTLKKTK